MTFGDGDDAVRHFKRLCENKLFDPPACIVFCDIKMPRLSGFEVLKWFRGQPKLSVIPFVVLSGSNEAVDREQASALGAGDYLVKFPPEARFAQLIRGANDAVRRNFRAG
jgi:CheY-like chemotaxis protein